jgi:hypothetical protein
LALQAPSVAPSNVVWTDRFRRTSEKAMREWALSELASGRVTIAEIKRERSSEPARALTRPDAIRPSGEPRALS